MVPEWMSRTALLVGEDEIERLQKSHVLIVGLGGVGGICAEMIARAGVGTLTIVDGDDIEASNCNRQIVATHSAVGKTKADVMAQRILDINPQANLHIKDYYIKDELIDQLFENAHYDYVADCIDTLSPKVFLIKHCVDNNIPIVSSMGAGSKLDPSKVKVVDISKTYNCRLAKYVRKRLQRFGIKKNLKVVFSPERENPGEVTVLETPAPKKSVVGTISYMPNIFGIFVAATIINDLIDKKNRKN